MNSPEEWQQLRSLVEDALLLPPDQRAQFVNAEAGTGDLAREAMRMLAFEGQATVIFSIEGWRDRAARTTQSAAWRG